MKVYIPTKTDGYKTSLKLISNRVNSNKNLIGENI